MINPATQLAARPPRPDAPAPIRPSLTPIASLWAAGIAAALLLPLLGDNPDIQRAAYSIRVSSVFLIAAFFIALFGPSGRKWFQIHNLLWTAAWAAYLVHFIVSVFFAFDGDIHRIYTRQTFPVATYNFIITAVWTLDIVLLTWSPFGVALLKQRFRTILTALVHVAVAAGFLVAQVLFKSGIALWLGIALIATITLGVISTAWINRRRQAKSPLRRLLDLAIERLEGSVYLDPEFRQDFSSIELFRQAKRDLWAKEVQTGYTTTYVWMANQLGHFTLGLFPLLLASWIANILFGAAKAASLGEFILPAIAAAIIIWKEWGDYRTSIKDAQAADSYFRIDRSDLLLDAGTAVLYMLLGVLVGAAAIRAAAEGASRPILAFLVVLSLVFGPAGHWLRRKKCFQMADVPFVFRFANVGPNFSVDLGDTELVQRDAANVIKEFVELRGNVEHLILYGPSGAGKTSLAVGIGTEHAFQQGKARFVTFFQFLQIASFLKEEPLQENRDLWPWRDARILLIDDVDAGLDLPPGSDGASTSLIRPSEAIEAIGVIDRLHQRQKPDALPALGPVIADLRARRTVWVLGESADIDDWRAHLSALLTAPIQSIGVVKLENPDRPTPARAGRAHPGPLSTVRGPEAPGAGPASTKSSGN